MEGDKKVPIFVLVIHLSGSGGSQNLQSSTEGWVVTRKLQDFQAVHEKLVQVSIMSCCMLLTVLRGHGTVGRLSVNFCDFLFAFLHTKSLLKRGLL